MNFSPTRNGGDAHIEETNEDAHVSWQQEDWQTDDTTTTDRQYHRFPQAWPRSYDDRRNSFLRYYDRLVVSTQQKEWQCISPMTQHIIPHPPLSPPTHDHTHAVGAISEPETGGRIRKRRSQSFNDYIDRLDDDDDDDDLPVRSALTLPPLLQQSQEHDPFIATPAMADYGSVTISTEEEQDRRSTSSTFQSIPDNEDYKYSDNGYNVTMTEMDDSIANPQQILSTTGSPENLQSLASSSEQCPSLDNWRQSEEQQPLKLSVQDKNDATVERDDGNPLYVSILYGAINCTIVIPVVMSFGNIIYRDDAFAPYMPVLIKLTLVSGFVHQMCFSTFSTLKFAVGSVQDAGLIFLSSMAADIVAYCRREGYNDETMLATVTVGLGLSAALLGIGLVIVGRLGLAGYVQMLPTCVVAGYLAYIGWFVGYSGLGIMAGTSSLTIALLLENILFVLPGVAGGIFIYASVQKFRHVAVLPLCITLLLLAFYVGLILSGSSIQQTTENGWIRQTEKAPVWYHTWDYLKIDLVAWGALPQLWLTWSGMLFVVALSSSLDVAAIELEMKRPLNYNHELRMVGISNFVSGMTGGYTGSYIFSQSIFSLRIGIRSRMAGFALAFFQLVIILIPFPILSYVPNFFYGSLLSMICMDLMYEWLWEFRSKVTTAEYLIGLSTFALIHFLGVEYGILLGVVVYVGCRYLKIDVGELKQIPTQEDRI
jgi:MFS superfamily sulfate permease-like transporter